MKQKVVTKFFPISKLGYDFQALIDEYSSQGWTVKQISTTGFDQNLTSGRNILQVPSIAITLLLEIPD